jgi:hypothetical protein
VKRAPWTYEVPPAGSDAVGREDYQVESAVGEQLGKVKSVLRHDDDVYVAVESGVPPVVRRVHAVKWHDVEDVDHDSLTVRLRMRSEEFARQLELDPGRGLEGERAEARRVTEIPPGAATSTELGGVTGPVDRPSYLVALGLGLAGVLATLIAIVVVTTTESESAYAVFGVPAILLGAAAVLGYRFLRRPSERL